MANPPSPQKPPRPGWVGPLFGWELLRLARRGQDMRGRFFLAVSLLCILTLFAILWFNNVNIIDLFTGTSQSLSLEESSQFGQWFAMVFIVTQFTVMCLLTPGYAAGGIAEEKEKKTLVFLLVSDLTNREILFGKFLGRLVFLLGILLAGLPILSLTQLYGGVSLNLLLMAYLITAGTMFLLAAMSAACAFYATTFRGALFRSYCLGVLFVVLGFGIPYFSPYVVIVIVYNLQVSQPDAFWLVGGGYTAVECVLACIAIGVAIRRLGQIRRARDLAPRTSRGQERQVALARRSRGRQIEPIPRAKSLRTAADPRPTDEIREPEWIVPESSELSPGHASSQEPAANAARPSPQLGVRPLTRTAATPHRTPGKALLPSPGEPAPTARFRRRMRPPPMRVPTTAYNDRERPRVPEGLPFHWKEQFVRGSRRTADDESIRSVVIAVVISLVVVLSFFLFVTFMGVLFSRASEGALRVLSNFLLVVGHGTLFIHWLILGFGAMATIMRERQRLTLESLLTIPEPRRLILDAKWRVSIRRNWAASLTGVGLLAVGFLLSDYPLMTLPVLIASVAAPWLLVNLGLWLGMTTTNATRGLMWLLVVLGGCLVLPLAAWVGPTATDAWIWLLGTSFVAGWIPVLAWIWQKAAYDKFDRYHFG